MQKAREPEHAVTPQVARHETVAGSRLTPMPGFVDVGEQIVGSNHIFEIAAPFNIGRGGARVDAKIADGSAFVVESVPHTLAEAGPAMSQDQLSTQLSTPIRIRFSPTKRDSMLAELTLSATWGDGTSELVHVKLMGHAREIREVPRPTPEQIDGEKREREESKKAAALREKHQQEYEADKATEILPPWADDHLRDAAAAARDNAMALAGAQRAGVDVVVAEIGTYKPPPMPRSAWWDLVELALTLGSGVVADLVGRYIARAIGGALLETTKDSSFVSGLGGAIRNGLTTGAKKAIEGTKGEKEQSTSGRIAFFESQWDALNATQAENASLVTEQAKFLHMQLRKAPESAIEAMRAIGDGFASAIPAAKEAQKRATSTEWLAYRARVTLGTEELETHEHATKLDPARASHHPTPDGFKGLLDVMVTLEHGNPKVIGARVPGIARAVAQHLLGADLVAGRVPLRLIVGWNEPDPTIITRDDAGRVRVSGGLARLRDFRDDGGQIDREAQAILAAEALVTATLSRPLGAWGIDITTDDKSKGDD